MVVDGRMQSGPSCHAEGIQGYGPIPADICFVGIAPGRHEMQSGRPFTGQSGKLLRNILEAVNVNPGECYLTNLCCTPREKPTIENIVACRSRFQAEIAAVRPKLIVALGAVASSVFQPAYKFGEVRGSFDYYPPYDCWVLVTYHPAAMLHGDSGESRENIASDIVLDLKQINRFFMDRPTPADRVIEYSVLDNVGEAARFIQNLPKDRPVSLDVETNNKETDVISPFDDKLLCLAISFYDSAGKQHTAAIPADIVRQVPAELWNGPQWLYHYGTFDTQALMRLGIDLPIAHDSLLAHYCIDERSGRQALKPHTRQYSYADHYERKIAAVRVDMRRAHPDDLYRYNAYDAAYTLRNYTKFVPMMHDEGTEWLYKNLLLPAVNTFKYMQYHGVPFSRERALNLARQWLPLYREKDLRLRELVRQAGGNQDINFDSPQQLSKFLYEVLRLPRAPAKTSTATGKDILEVLADEHEFVRGLLDIRHLSKMLSTYVFGILDDIKFDDRVHPIPLLHGTVSGRLAYSDPPINTIPRPYMKSEYGPELRKLFVAEPDHVILELDYKQAELWMAWFYSQDPVLGADLQSGDIHRRTAGFIADIPPEQVSSEQRFQAKKTNFGKIYFIGNDKLAKQIERPITEAAKWSALWDARYQVYVHWANSLFGVVQETGEITTVTHRKRRFPIVLDRRILNQIINYPIQGTSHDNILASIIEGYWPLREQFNAYILLDIHDAIIIHARIDNWQYVAKYMVNIMEQPRFGFPAMRAEVKVGDSWGEVKEVEVD